MFDNLQIILLIVVSLLYYKVQNIHGKLLKIFVLIFQFSWINILHYVKVAHIGWFLNSPLSFHFNIYYIDNFYTL